MKGKERKKKKRMTQIYTRVDKNRKERCTQILVVKTSRKERKKEGKHKLVYSSKNEALKKI
jgi:hypothetical protein